MIKTNYLDYNLLLTIGIDYSPLTVSPQTPIKELILLMADQRNFCQISATTEDLKNMGKCPITPTCVLAVENNKQIKGLITERDIVRFVAKEMNIDDYTAQDLMTKPVITLNKSQLKNTFEILNAFKQNEIRHLPIVDEQNQLMGLVTPQSLRQVLQPADLLKWRSVKEIMTTDVVHASPQASLMEVTKLMSSHHISCVLIAEKTNTNKLIPLGIITERDVVQYRALDLDFQSITADKLMSTPLFSISEDSSLWAAHQTMQEKRIRRLTIVDSDNFLVGILTQTNILSAIDTSEMYGVIQVLQKKVNELQDENLKLLQERNFNLEKDVEFHVLKLEDKEKDLRKERDFANAIIDTVGALVVVLDQEGKVVRFNKTAEKVSCYNFEEVQGKFLRDLFISDTDKEQFLLLFNQLLEQDLDFPSVLYENSWLTKTGDRLLISWSNTVLYNLNGQVEYIICAGIDITKQKQVELELHNLNQELENRVKNRTKELEELVQELERKKKFIQRITDTTPNIIYLYNLSHKKNTYINQKISSLLGYEIEEIESMEDELMKELIHEDDLRKIEEYHQKFEHAKENEIREIEYRMKDVEGKYHWLLSRDLVFSRTADGKPKEILGTATDITERKQIEDKLTKLNQELLSKLEELKQRNQEITLLNEINDFLQASLSIKEAGDVLADLLQPLFPNTTGAIMMDNSQKKFFEIISSWGDKINTKSCFSTNECWSLRRGRFHYSHKNQIGLSCDHILGETEFTESLCIPLIAQGEALGLFFLSTLNEKIFTDVQIKLACTVGEQIALAFSNLRLQEQLQEQNIRDPLTSLFNRRYLTKILDTEIKMAATNHQSLAIIMVDVDHFKKFNDTYGHDIGDRVLKEIAILLQNNIKSTDIACRYGGEELTLILNNIRPENAYKKGEQLREKIKKISFQYEDQVISNITVSMGIACYPSHGRKKELLLKLSDQALYQAKDEGRDKVVMVGEAN